MRHYITILTLTFFSLTSLGQKQNIDTLISKIDNQQIVIMMQYVWFPKMFSSAGDSLIKIGRSATNKLIPFLSDTSKGIIAHYILSNIWSDKLNGAGQKLASGVSPVSNDTLILRIIYTDFVYYQDDKRKNFAIQTYLDKNKRRWISFFKGNIFREQ